MTLTRERIESIAYGTYSDNEQRVTFLIGWVLRLEEKAARMQSALQQILVEHDTDTWQYELAHEAIYPGEPIERDNDCPRCHGQGDLSGPYKCPSCLGTGERRREAS